MNPDQFGFKKIKDILSWPELRGIWPVLILLVFVLAAGYNLPAGFFILQGGLVVVAGVFVFALVYRTASIERKDKFERNQFKNVLFGLEDALLIYDDNFKVLFFNPAAERLFKLDSAAVIGSEFSPKDIAKPEFKLLAQVIFTSLAPSVVSRSPAGRYPQVVDLSFAEPLLDLQVLTSPISDESGKFLGFMKVIRDRTRELSLIRSKSEFLTVASHQLRTPVTDIKWGLEALVGDKTLSVESKDIVTNTLAASKGLLKIVEDLLNTAKIEEGRFGYDFKQTDIVEFINGILLLVIPAARRSGIKIYFDKPKAPLPGLMIDTQKLSLAINNIIENSIRYNVENGEIAIKVERIADGPFVEVRVRDTGIGMVAADIPKLFKKFYRGKEASMASTEGSGLGLYIAKNIIQAHGGRIWVDSEQGRGSTFHFTLPTDPKLVPQHGVVTEE